LRPPHPSRGDDEEWRAVEAVRHGQGSNGTSPGGTRRTGQPPRFRPPESPGSTGGPKPPTCHAPDATRQEPTPPTRPQTPPAPTTTATTGPSCEPCPNRDGVERHREVRLTVSPEWW